MTCEEARAALCIWSHNNILNAILEDAYDEAVSRERCQCYTPVHMELGAVHCRRYGDGVGYAVSLSEQFARKKERLRRLMGYLDRVNEMVGKEAPRDPSMRAALRFRERTMSVWERVGMMCGVEAASARNVQRAMLRRICIHPWSERERALAAFACRYVKAGALARTLRGLGVLEG